MYGMNWVCVHCCISCMYQSWIACDDTYQRVFDCLIALYHMAGSGCQINLFNELQELMNCELLQVQLGFKAYQISYGAWEYSVYRI